MWNNLVQAGSVYSDAVDCILCSVGCIIVMPCLALVAISFGRSDEEEIDHLDEIAETSDARAAGAATALGLNEASNRAISSLPLLAADSLGRGNGSAQMTAAAGASDAAKKAMAREVEQQRHDRFLQRHKALQLRQNFVSGALLFVSSGLQLFVGIKCIGFKFTDEATQGWLMGLGVLWINIMSWSVSEVPEFLPCNRARVAVVDACASRAAPLLLLPAKYSPAATWARPESKSQRGSCKVDILLLINFFPRPSQD